MIEKIASKLSSVLCGIRCISYVVRAFRDFLTGLKAGWEESQKDPSYDRKEFNKVTQKYIDMKDK